MSFTNANTIKIRSASRKCISLVGIMKTSSTAQIECTYLPILSSRNHGWENILVEQFQIPAGEGKTYYNIKKETI